jgi:hypothetical protein
MLRAQATRISKSIRMPLILYVLTGRTSHPPVINMCGEYKTWHSCQVLSRLLLNLQVTYLNAQ